MAPIWLTQPMVRALHGRAAAAFGGGAAPFDENLLARVLERPRSLYAYGEAPPLASLAGAYCRGIAWERPFAGGNGRTGLLAVAAFLALNGYAFRPVETEAVVVVEGVMSGEIEPGFLERWISDHATPRRA